MKMPKRCNEISDTLLEADSLHYCSRLLFNFVMYGELKYVNCFRVLLKKKVKIRWAQK